MVNDNNENDLIEIPEPSSPGKYTNIDILTGKGVEPIDQLKLYNASDWEQFVNEWACAVLKNKYSKVWRSKGSGDKGRDVIGFYSEPIATSEWDNYQCKHYKNPLTPSDIWQEIGKFLYFQFIGAYTKPRSYQFVAPQGIGNKLILLLQNPSSLKSELIKIWDDKCKNNILEGTDIAFEGTLKTFVESYDFSIFSFIEPQTLIEQHADTKWHAIRFGKGLRKIRPTPDKPPSEIQPPEQVYIGELKRAYADHEKTELTTEEINKHNTYGEHYRRQRENFYEAESLKRFAAETLADGGRYEDLEKEIFDGVIDVVESNHESGFEKVKETLKNAKQIQISDHPLKSQVTPGDRGGICHQLVNKKKIKWTK